MRSYVNTPATHLEAPVCRNCVFLRGELWSGSEEAPDRGWFPAAATLLFGHRGNLSPQDGLESGWDWDGDRVGKGRDGVKNGSGWGQERFGMGSGRGWDGVRMGWGHNGVGTQQV